jgi:hypothetical protein
VVLELEAFVGGGAGRGRGGEELLSCPHNGRVLEPDGVVAGGDLLAGDAAEFRGVEVVAGWY